MKAMQQKGFVSIITAAVLMVIMALITIGFSRIMAREQRQAIDRQLSTQAYYAAETAVNDVRAVIESNPTSPLVTNEKTDCDVSAWNNGAVASADSAVPSFDLGAASNLVTYTCLMIDPTPTILEFNNGSISDEESRIFTIEPESGTISDLTFSWTGEDNNASSFASPCPGSGSFSFPTNWPANRLPVLRIDLINVGTGALSRASLINNTAQYYVYPCNGSGSVIFSGANQGRIIPARCSSGNDYQCSVDVNVAGGASRLVARVRSIYKPANMQVTSTLVGGGVTEFVGAQTVVDATGKANDVLRRIKVHLSTEGKYALPEYVFQARDGLCKRLVVEGANTVTGLNECN